MTTQKKKQWAFWLFLALIIFLIAQRGYGQNESFFGKLISPGIKWNDREYSNVNILIDPWSSYKESGLNAGAEIEYVGIVLGKGAYIKATATHFFGYNPDYTDFYGSGGISLISDFEGWRYYAGGKLGVIIREGVHPSAGLEAGIDYMVSDNFGFGLNGDWVYRSDFEFQGGDNEMRPSVRVKAIFKLKDL
jgi:hypothetical protein